MKLSRWLGVALIVAVALGAGFLIGRDRAEKKGCGTPQGSDGIPATVPIPIEEPAPASPSKQVLEQLEGSVAAPSFLPDGSDCFVAVVTLKNNGATPLRLDPCPAYQLRFGEDASVFRVESQLDCSQFEEGLVPGSAVAYAFEVEVPADARGLFAAGVDFALLTSDDGYLFLPRSSSVLVDAG